MTITFPTQLKSPCPLDAISKMLSEERLVLYSLVVGTNPQSVLEIGRSHGGSAIIIQSALEHNDCGGSLVSLDEAGQEGPHGIAPGLQEELTARGVRFIQARSPEGLPRARAMATSPFDFVLIDGEHNGEQCLDDLEGCLPHLAPGAWLLFHDCWYPAVERSIAIALERHPLHDCGILSTRQNRRFMDRSVYDKPVIWAGLRLLRFNP